MLDADMIAIQALAFLVAEDERRDRFLTLTGIDPLHWRDMTRDRATLGAVLDYLLQWEPLLLDFAAELHIDPALIVRLRRDLPGASLEY